MFVGSVILRQISEETHIFLCDQNPFSQDHSRIFCSHKHLHLLFKTCFTVKSIFFFLQLGKIFLLSPKHPILPHHSYSLIMDHFSVCKTPSLFTFPAVCLFVCKHECIQPHEGSNSDHATKCHRLLQYTLSHQSEHHKLVSFVYAQATNRLHLVHIPFP